MASSFQDLRVWREAIKLAVSIYGATEKFPKHELYGPTSQIRRAAVSVASNIAEGKGHRSSREFCNFLFHARGSLLELQTQLIIARELKYLPQTDAEALLAQAASAARGLNALIDAVRPEVSS
ncbi:MAG TPA: four helix bundle protein [Bryobacteraceae bacterium]|nr:four helix bundle protein [Bryobacteraceae bacterium]